VIEDAGYLRGYLSGLTLAFLVLLWSVFLLGSLYLALVAGDVVGKEVEDGNHERCCADRFPVVDPALKLAAVFVYSFVLIWFVAITALLVGFIHSGAGGLLFAPMERIFRAARIWAGLARYFAGVFLLSLSLLDDPVDRILPSCLDMKPAAATIGTLSFLFVDMILKNIPFFESLKLSSSPPIWPLGSMSLHITFHGKDGRRLRMAVRHQCHACRPRPCCFRAARPEVVVPGHPQINPRLPGSILLNFRR